MNNNREQLIQQFFQTSKRILHSALLPSYPFKDFTLSRPQIILLFHIAKHEQGVSMKELAEHLCVTNGAVTQFIDDLVEKKLLVREQDPHDRRSIRVRLSESDRESFGEFKDQYIQSMLPRFDKITTEELHTLLKLMEKITLRT